MTDGQGVALGFILFGILGLLWEGVKTFLEWIGF